MKKYEMKTFVTDPFDVMCGDCEAHEIEIWKPVTMRELQELHEYTVSADKQMLVIDKIQFEDMTGEPWEPTPEDFSEFLEKAIGQGYIREV